jgi:hypothetical protein
MPGRSRRARPASRVTMTKKSTISPRSAETVTHSLGRGKVEESKKHWPGFFLTLKGGASRSRTGECGRATKRIRINRIRVPDLVLEAIGHSAYDAPRSRQETYSVQVPTITKNSLDHGGRASVSKKPIRDRLKKEREGKYSNSLFFREAGLCRFLNIRTSGYIRFASSA